MDYIEGNATNVSHELDVDLNGQMPEDRVGSSGQKFRHLCSFHIDGKKITLSSMRPISITDGDKIALAGKSKPETFRAYAYSEAESGELRGPPPLGYGAMMVAALVGAVFVANLGWLEKTPEIRWVALFFAAAAGLLALYLAFCGLRARRARQLLKRHRDAK